MTAAQKKARENFSKAIAYRKKTGCSLKQAFAHIKGGKIKGLDKVVKKGNKTAVIYSKKAAPKKKAIAKNKVVKQGKLFGVKKYAITLHLKDDAILYANANTLTEANKLYILAQKVKVKDLLRTGEDFVLIDIYDNINNKQVKEKVIKNKNI
jgi:transcriptional antiterminator Rof (Rho-off)